MKAIKLSLVIALTGLISASVYAAESAKTSNKAKINKLTKELKKIESDCEKSISDLVDYKDKLKAQGKIEMAKNTEKHLYLEELDCEKNIEAKKELIKSLK